jgi:phosphate transport system ATP-binding protein
MAGSFAQEMVSVPASAAHLEFRDVTVRYGVATALEGITLDVPRHQIFGIIGPAGSGKSTLLKCTNRMIDVVGRVSVHGQLRIDQLEVFRLKNVHDLRRKVGMVLPLPVGLPLSVYDNVAFAPRAAGHRDRAVLDETVERCLRQAALWDEVKDRLRALGTTLSGGQQQRLAIARALSHGPDVLCLDEFSIAVDPVTTMKIEDALLELKERMTILMATNLVQQARRLADRVAFLNAGRLIEEGSSDVIFSDHPANRLTFDYIRGHFG